MRQKQGIGMFKDPDTLVLKGLFCKSGHCTLIVEVKEIKKQDQFSYWYCALINMVFSKVGFLLLFASLSVASVAPKMVVKCVKNEV